ncbi:hypothetical protein NBRC116583_01520 [Arenicella sp. 4NH20-0111]
MNLIKRLTTSVTATLEGAVGQLENHDAIIDASIKQTRQAVAKTQARLATLRQQQNAYESQLQLSIEQIKVWENRAKSLATENESKALQCLTRRNQNEAESNRLKQSIEQQDGLISSVSTNLSTLKTKLDEMTQRHNLMRSRQAVADVSKVTSKSNISEQLDETFERWESVVLETELAVSDACCSDPLEAQFAQQEDKAKLLDQLSALKDKNNSV